MSSWTAPALGTSELVYRWLSHVERSSTSHHNEFDTEAEHGGKSKAGRALNHGSDTINGGRQRVKDTAYNPRDSDKRDDVHHPRTAAYRPSQIAHDNDDVSDCATPRSPHAQASVHEHVYHDPTDKYARRPRHNTREDRYTYKADRESHKARRQPNTKIRKRTSAVLNEDFRAPNVSTERLTLNSNGPGFLNKGKSSNTQLQKGVPDLTFSGMTFLKRKREDDASRFEKLKEQNTRRKLSKPRSEEISAFFSRAADSKQTASLTPHTTAESYVSWSTSPPRKRLPSTTERSNHVGRLHSSRASQVDNTNSPAHALPGHPSSSFDNQLWDDITAKMLFRGVETFAKGTDKPYSLEDLKMLAQAIDAQDLPQETPAALRDIIGSAVSPDGQRHNHRRESDSAAGAQPGIMDLPAYCGDFRKTHLDSSRDDEPMQGHLPLQNTPIRSPAGSGVEKIQRWSSKQEALTPAGADLVQISRDMTPGGYDSCPIRSEPPVYTEPSGRFIYSDQPSSKPEKPLLSSISRGPGIYYSTNELSSERVSERMEPRQHFVHDEPVPLIDEWVLPAAPFEVQRARTVTSASDDLDQFDKNLLRHANTDFVLTEAQINAAKATVPDVNWPNEALEDHHLQATSKNGDVHFREHHAAEPRLLYETPGRREQRASVVDDHLGHLGGFSGFSRRQLLY